MNRNWFYFVKVFSIVCIALLLIVGVRSQFISQPDISSAASLEYTKVTLPGERVLQSSVVAADFNNDGYKELVVGGQDGMLHVAAYNGSSWSTVWSRQTAVDFNAAGAPAACPNASSSTILSTAAIADLDGDGSLEIVVTTGGIPASHYNGGVIVYTHDSSSPWSFSMVPGWPQPRYDEIGNGSGMRYPDGCWDSISVSPVVGDLDGDGDLEISVQSLNRRIYAWHHDATDVAGWPIYRDSGDDLLRGGVSSPAMGDIDGDGLPEVVLGTNSPPWEDGGPAPDYSKATVWAINGDSSNVPGWPVETYNNIFSSPALGDIDGDGALEVVIGSGSTVEGGNGRYVYAWNGDGSAVSGWPKEAAGDMPAPPALGDLDGDGELEVVAGCGTEYGQTSTTCDLLYAWRGDGTDVPGFPVHSPSNGYDPGWGNPYGLPYSPVLADYDGDGSVEILVQNDRAFGPTVVDKNGSTYADPNLRSLRSVYNPSLVDDVDNDGDLEVILAGADIVDNVESGGVIYIFEVNGDKSDARPWPMFHHDVELTGVHPLAPKPPALVFPSEVRLFHQSGSGNSASTYVVVANSGEGEFDWNLTHAISELQVLPVSGTVSSMTSVQFVVDTTGFSTDGWHELGTVTVTGSDGGEAVSESPVESTIYLYIGDVGCSYMPLVVR